MSTTEWVIVAGASWAAASPFIGATVGRAIRRADRPQPDPVTPAAYPPPVPPSVNWIPVLPPVPPPSVNLLDDAPTEILAVDERDRQFFAIVNAERWFVDGAV